MTPDELTGAVACHGLLLEPGHSVEVPVSRSIAPAYARLLRLKIAAERIAAEQMGIDVALEDELTIAIRDFPYMPALNKVVITRAEA